MNYEILEREALMIERCESQPGAGTAEDEAYPEASLAQVLNDLLPLRRDSEALDEVLGLLKSPPVFGHLVSVCSIDPASPLARLAGFDHSPALAPAHCADRINAIPSAQ
jgi:hypothetical protein